MKHSRLKNENLNDSPKKINRPNFEHPTKLSAETTENLYNHSSLTHTVQQESRIITRNRRNQPDTSNPSTGNINHNRAFDVANTDVESGVERTGAAAATDRQTLSGGALDGPVAPTRFL